MSESTQLSHSQVTARGISVETVEEISRRRDEPASLRSRRLAAWEAYEAIPLPTLRDEEWRRTDIRALRLANARLMVEKAPGLSDSSALPDALRAAIADWDGRAGLLVQRDASVVHLRAESDLAARGVIFSDLETAAREHHDLFERFFMAEAVRLGNDKFAALHAALWSGGAFLYVPRGVRVELPLQSVFWSDRPDMAIFPHTLIVAEEGSEVTYIDQYASVDAPGEAQGLASGVVEIIARPGARVRYFNLQEWGGNVWSFSSQVARIERDATVDTLVAAFGGKLSKARVQSQLLAPGASSQMLGVLFGSERQVFDHHTLQDHDAPQTTSDLLYKAVLKDSARSVFSGLIRARRHAQKTDAVQTNRNLLLSNKARADSIPKLEIEANDLRCTHAAAVAPVDAEQLFYLQSRGLDRLAATQAIVEGFFEPLLEKIPLPGVRERIRATVARKMGQEFGGSTR